MNQPDKDSRNRIMLLLEEAYTSRVNDLRHSIRLAKEALSESKEVDDKALMGRSLNQLSLYYMIMGEYKRSVSMAEQAIIFFEELNHEKGIADAKYSLAGVCYKTDNYHLGLVYLIDCLTIYKKFHDYHNQARAQKSLGTIYEYFGDRKNAIKSYEYSIKAAKKAGDSNLESNAYNPLSGIYLKQNKIKKALDIIERAIAMKKQTGDVRGLAFALYGRGKVYIRTKQHREAETDLKEAIRIHLEMGERLGTGMAYYKLGLLYVETCEFKKAKSILGKALKFSTTYNIAIIKFKSEYLLCKVYKAENNPVKSLFYLEQYLKQKEAVINTQSLKIIENYELITKMESLKKEAQLQKEKAEIIEKKNHAEHAAKVKQEFLSTMSHEIRTPLNAVITIASLLENKSQEEDEKPLIGSLKFAANSLLMLVNDILDFTKLETGKVSIELQPVDFRTLLENIRNTYASMANEKGLTLLLKVDKNVARLYDMDELKIMQILSNLVGNAIKFTDKGTITIGIEKLEGNAHADHLKFTVTDTGIGIARNHLDEIFESFSQPSSITTRKQGGSGLGLAIVKKLVALHGGIVQVKSMVGKGSVFYFDIKLKKADVAMETVTTQSNMLKDKLVLLAEDNPVNAMVALKLLSNWQITTEHVKNGLEAIEKANKKVFDFILMDIHMPEMDGFEATMHLRKFENPNKRTPIFALTADVTADVNEDFAPYFNAFLSKPIEIDKLYDALIHG
jgi:signal transduction histidine kinase/CheY-like chemotaxis protein